MAEFRETKTPVVLFDDDQLLRGGKTAREYYEELFVTKVAEAIDDAPVGRDGPSKP